jgi:hypothetical protein
MTPLAAPRVENPGNRLAVLHWRTGGQTKPWVTATTSPHRIGSNGRTVDEGRPVVQRETLMMPFAIVWRDKVPRLRAENAAPPNGIIRSTPL